MEQSEKTYHATTNTNGHIKKHVVLVDSRDLFRGCMAIWLREFRREFAVSAFSCALKGIAPEIISNCGVAVLCTDALPSQEQWLERQVAALREQKPDLPIVAVADESAEDVIASLDLQGYIPTSSSMEVAAATLRLVLAGGSNVARRRGGQSLARGIAMPPTQYQPEQPSTSRLTPREELVFHLLAHGIPNKIIAYKLGMSVNTVKIHVHHIIRKLGVRNRTQVAVFGYCPSGEAAAASRSQPARSAMVA
jgi:DNA-binding NarL/FixJ family response regulator